MINLRNFVDVAYLETFVPEIAQYKWTTQSSILTYRQAVEEKVLGDFSNRGYKFSELRPSLVLRSSTDTVAVDTTGASFNEEHERRRLVYNVTVRTGTTALVLQGSNDELTWDTITTQSITATGEGSFLFVAGYDYYRLNSTITAGTLAYTAYLTETSYDRLFAYYWIYLVLLNAGKGEDNQYTQYANVWLKLYQDEWASVALLLDDNGVIEASSQNITFGR
jgi:hypothetical protein